MNRVKVGELRNHLSKYLKKVQEGREVLITDRARPIGRIVPYLGDEERDEALVMKKPAKGFEGLGRIRFPHRNIRSSDSVEDLLKDRRRR